MKILDFINELRNTDRYIEEIYLNGSCYKFHLLLKKMYPSSIGYISKEKNHIITKYRNKFYDITGIVNDYHDYTMLNKNEEIFCQKWGFYEKNLLLLTECDNCGEPITYNMKNINCVDIKYERFLI